MPRTKYPIFKCLHRGEKGFTLIELLIVIAILGIIAAVVIPNLGRFMGRGKVEAANTEAHNVQTAVTACMVENNWSTYAGSVGPGQECTCDTGVPLEGTAPPDFYTGNLQAVYTIGNGEITGAVVTIGGKWEGLQWALDGSGWEEETETIP